MNDKEGSGNVSLEGAMQILYLRYGRGLLDAQLEEIFGTSDLNSGMWLVHLCPLQGTHLPFICCQSVDTNSIFASRRICNWLNNGHRAAGKTLTLTEFLQSLHLSQIKQLRNRVTAKTYKPPPLPNKKSAAV